MPAIFISYRRDDSRTWAIWLADQLAANFGNDIFLDKDDIHAGKWSEQIDSALAEAKVVIVVIGKSWLSATDQDGRIRLGKPDDVHRREIAQALAQPNVTLIPICVDGARMPNAEELPADLANLPEHQARELGDAEHRRNADLKVIAQDIANALGRSITIAQSTAPISRLRIICVSVAIVVAIGIYFAYHDMPLDSKAIIFVFLVVVVFIYAIELLIKQLQRRRKSGRKQ